MKWLNIPKSNDGEKTSSESVSSWDETKVKGEINIDSVGLLEKVKGYFESV